MKRAPARLGIGRVDSDPLDGEEQLQPFHAFLLRIRANQMEQRPSESIPTVDLGGEGCVGGTGEVGVGRGRTGEVGGGGLLRSALGEEIRGLFEGIVAVEGL